MGPNIAGYFGHADTRMGQRSYAHHHPHYQDKPTRALAEALAGIGAAQAGRARARQDQGAPGGTPPETSPVECDW